MKTNYIHAHYGCIVQELNRKAAIMLADKKIDEKEYKAILEENKNNACLVCNRNKRSK
jgi:hypothetical protein